MIYYILLGVFTSRFLFLVSFYIVSFVKWDLCNSFPTQYLCQFFYLSSFTCLLYGYCFITIPYFIFYNFLLVLYFAQSPHWGYPAYSVFLFITSDRLGRLMIVVWFFVLSSPQSIILPLHLSLSMNKTEYFGLFPNGNIELAIERTVNWFFKNRWLLCHNALNVTTPIQINRKKIIGSFVNCVVKDYLVSH